MAGRYVYNAAGQKVWVEDGSPGPGTSQSGPTGGFAMGTKEQNTGWRDLPNFASNKEAARLMWEGSSNPNQIAAAQASPVEMNRAAELATRAKQYEMLGAYEQMAAGGGPSVAGHATREGMDATARAMMASKGGLRGTLSAGSAMGADTAMKGASMKAAEQQGAWGALNSAASGVRAQDIQGDTEAAKLYQQVGLANAGFKQQAGLANQDAQLAMLGNRVGAAQQYGGLVADNAHANVAYDQMGRDRIRKANEYKRIQHERDWAGYKQMINTAAMAMVAASDERVKTDVAPGDKDLSQLYGALAPYEYEYKDPSIDGASPGRHVSVMAQDLEKSEIGKRAVSESPEGHKVVDYGKLLPAQVAATAWLHKRLDKIEKALTKRRSR